MAVIRSVAMMFFIFTGIAGVDAVVVAVAMCGTGNLGLLAYMEVLKVSQREVIEQGILLDT